MEYKETIEYLFGLQKHGMKFGLDNIRKLTAASGHPQNSFHAVHVAGTNGKGSTSAMIESILRTSGVRTGLFTSPHLISFTERIRVNGEEISEENVIALAQEVRKTAERFEDFSPTFFEVVTAMAFLHFRNEKVDWAVIETGLGGRLDATNVITPEACVITDIGIDHSEFLGKSLAEIASEKAGIIKPGVPVVTSAQPREVIEKIRGRAAEMKSPLYTYGEDFSASDIAEDPEGLAFSYHGRLDYIGLAPALSGLHQIKNASMAVKTIEIVGERYPELRFDISGGLSRTKWPGRLEMASENPPILIDGAHNPHAAAALAAHLKKMLQKNYRRIILVAGIMSDKDIVGITEPLIGIASEIIFTSPAYGRAAAPETLVSSAASLGYGAKTAATVAEALISARKLWQPGDLIVVTGSFYTIGEAKEALGNKGVLSRLRE